MSKSGETEFGRVISMEMLSPLDRRITSTVGAIAIVAVVGDVSTARR